MPYHKETVKITKDGAEAMVSEREAKTYERLGWTRTDDGSSGDSSAPAEAEPKSEAPAAPAAT